MFVGYCERHNRLYDIRCVNGQWVYECPQCRAEGRYDVYMTSQTEMLPKSEWTVGSDVNGYVKPD